MSPPKWSSVRLLLIRFCLQSYIGVAFRINNNRNCFASTTSRNFCAGHPRRACSAFDAVALRSSVSESETSRADAVAKTIPSATRWAKRALLISSFSDGVGKSPKAQHFLKQSIVDVLRRGETTSPDEQTVETTSEDLDETLEKIVEENCDSSPLNLRLLYIPTAMYALRPESDNTPGKQRQRARADGKKRRSSIINQLKLLFEKFNVLAITLDLDDSSLKQPYGSDDASLFPTNGEAALTEWSPHLVYVEGGNTFWLQHCVEKGNWGPLLVDACTGDDAGAVYCGNSAGAIVAGKLVEIASWKGFDNPTVVEGKERHEDWEGVPGLGMVGDVSIFPHMSDEWSNLVASKKESAKYADVVCLEDGQVLYVDGTSERTILINSDS